MSPAVIDAIRHRRKPEFARDDERLIYDLVTEMNETRTLSQPTYDRAVAALGLDRVIELITVDRLLYDGRDHAQRLRRAGAGRRAAVALASLVSRRKRA